MTMLCKGFMVGMAALFLLSACHRRAEKEAPLRPDISPGLEPFAFRIGMTEAQVRKTLQCVENFRWTDGRQPVGHDFIQAQPWRLEKGRPSELSFFLKSNRLSQADIVYSTPTGAARQALFQQLFSNIVARYPYIQTATNPGDGLLVFFNRPDSSGWLMHETNEYESVTISLRSGFLMPPHKGRDGQSVNALGVAIPGE